MTTITIQYSDSFANWFAAVATFLAVCVALATPFIMHYLEKRRGRSKESSLQRIALHFMHVEISTICIFFREIKLRMRAGTESFQKALDEDTVFVTTPPQRTLAEQMELAKILEPEIRGKYIRFLELYQSARTLITIIACTQPGEPSESAFNSLTSTLDNAEAIDQYFSTFINEKASH